MPRLALPHAAPKEPPSFASRTPSCLAAFLLAWVSGLQASDTTFVSEGDRVRLTASQVSRARLVGTVSAFRSDTLVILPEGESVTFDVPWSEIVEIEVSRGTKSNLGKGLWIGALSGAVLGAGIGAALDCAAIADVDEGFCVVVGLAFGVGGGAVLGLAAGALSTTERWQKAEFPAPPPVQFGIGKDGSVRLAFSLRL
jgi:hypothetical protein